MSDLLSITDLVVGLPGADPVVKGVDVGVSRGRVLGIVGETGAGKTLTMRAILGSLPENLEASATSAAFDGHEVGVRGMDRLRGKRIGIIVQDPVGALPPIQSVGSSLVTLLRTHRPMSKAGARTRILEMLAEVGLPDPAAVMKMRPHQLSGGMAQRVVIAAAFMTNPDLIVADEPTTALDPTVQSQILALLKREVIERNVGAIIITHDIGVVAQACTDVIVMFDGRVKEAGTVEQVLTDPQDAYTKELLASLPDPDAFGATEPETAERQILSVEDAVKRYGGRHTTPVLNDVTLTVRAGRTIAIVGESGAGKSTLVRALLKLTDIDSGTIRLDGEDITRQSGATFRPKRRDIQIVYQNPTAALNPRLSVRRLISEPLIAFPETAPTEEDRNARLDELADAVRLDPAMLDRYPGELSGGQKQRVAIARALATRPEVVVLDEPTASLDLSVRRHIVDLLAELQRELGVAYVLVSHDFHTVRSLAHEVIVLYRGHVVESGPAKVVLRTPTDPYTRTLIAAELSPVPGQNADRWAAEGTAL
jgi:peptide/nickel transport system ATP-binding protein